MTDNKNKINSKKLFALVDKLKNEFTITPEINSVYDLELFIDNVVCIKHISCGNEYNLTLRSWLNLKKNPDIQGDNDKNTHYCKACINKLKKDDLQKFINEKYNCEFIVLGDYVSYHEKIELKHIFCEDTFFKSPSAIKSKRLFCKHCSKSDSIYEKELIEKRNQELKNKFKDNNVTTYIPLEDSSGLTKKMKFKHITCGYEFTSTPCNVYKNYSKHDHCPNCFKKKSKSVLNDKVKIKNDYSRIRSRYNKFLKFLEEFSFEPEISSIKDFKEKYQETFTITHKKCGRSLITKLDTWTKTRNRVSSKDKKNNFTYLCPHCSEEISRKDLQKFLNKKYNKEFLIVGKYISAKTPIDIKHEKCGEVFSLTPDMAKNKKIICKGCNNSDKKTEAKIQDKKNKQLLSKLKSVGLKDSFIPLEDFLGATKPMKFKHVRCGNITKIEPNKLLRSKYKAKHYCDKCPEQLLANETDKTLRTKYAQEALNIVNNQSKFNIIGDFDDEETTILLSHKDCLGKFQVSKRFLFLKETKCPHCETNNYKNNRFISINEKIKLYEKELNNEYKILKPFIKDEDNVPIMHIECGHIFHRTVYTFLRSKGKLFCPKCRKEKRNNELLDKLNIKYDNEISVCNMDIYKNVRTKLKFKHNKCGTIFESNFNNILDCKNIPCPKCNPEFKTLEKLKSDVFNKFKGEYIVVGEFKGYTKKIYFRHKKCGKLFLKTPYDFLNQELPCSHCLKESSLIGLKEAQKRVDKNSKGLFTLNGIYKGLKKEIPVTCNDCGHVFISTPKNIFLRKTCPNCKSTRT